MRIPVFALAALAAGAALAQTGARRDPLDPKVPGPKVEYRSVFEGYRPYAEPELLPWRQANEEVRDAAASHKGHPAGHGGGEKAPAKPPAKGDAHGGHK